MKGFEKLKSQGVPISFVKNQIAKSQIARDVLKVLENQIAKSSITRGVPLRFCNNSEHNVTDRRECPPKYFTRKNLQGFFVTAPYQSCIRVFLKVVIYWIYIYTFYEESL